MSNKKRSHRNNNIIATIMIVACFLIVGGSIVKVKVSKNCVAKAQNCVAEAWATTTTTEITTNTTKTTTTTTATTTNTTETTTTTTATTTNTTISKSEYVLLCNTVAHEAGSDWITKEEKAQVVEVIMNRITSPLYPDNIYDVLTQENQFSGYQNYIYLDTYSDKVTDLVKQGVDEYFSNQELYSHGYLNFYGDGYRNYFR